MSHRPRCQVRLEIHGCGDAVIGWEPTYDELARAVAQLDCLLVGYRQRQDRAPVQALCAVLTAALEGLADGDIDDRGGGRLAAGG